MKKIMKPFVLVAAAAMALASCQKNEMPAPEKQDVHFTINAGIETKTSIADNGDGTYSPSWENGDEIGIFFTEPKQKVEKVDATFSNTKEDGPVASFEGTATVDGLGTFYAFYPKSAFNQHYGDETIRLDLSAAQKPTSTSFDPACDILVAKPCDYLADGETVVIDDLYFARLMSVLKINLKGEFAQGEIVESLTFSVDGVDITGNAKVDYKNATITAWNNGNVDRNVVTASYAEDRYITIAEGNNAAYLVVAPTTIPAGTSLSFTLKTANYNISKTVSAPSDMTFTAGNLSVLNLTINEENCEANDTPIDYSGVYLIAGKEGDKWYAAKKYTSGNYLSVSEIEFIGENIVETETISDHYMTINKVADAPYKGMYTIVDAGGKYLSAVSGNDNYLKAVDAVSDNTYWSIEKDEEKGTYSIVASKSSDAEKNHMRFNYNSGTNSRVTCYGSTSTQPYLTLFSTSLVKPDTTPKITVTNTSYSALAEETSLEIPYTVKNITGNITATVASGATMSNVSTNVTTDKVTVSFAANKESAEKNATIVLSYEGAQSQEVVITQAAAGVTKQYYVKVTTAPTDWSGTYLMVCDSKNMVLSSISTSGTKYGVGTAVTITESKIEATETLASYQVVLSPGATSGSYLMKFMGSYLYWSSGNSLATNANNNANTNWILSVSSGNVTIKNCKDNTRVIGWNASSPRFACYTSSQTAIQLYKLEEGDAGGETPEPEPATPVLSVTSTEVNLNATDVKGEIAYSVENPVNGLSVSATTDAEWIFDFDYSVAGNVTFGVSENTGEERTTTITLAYEGAESKTVTVKQAAAEQGGGSEGGESDEPVTISKSISTYGFTNEQKVTSITLDDVITATASSGTNTGKYYTNDQTWRFYQNEEGTLTISAADNYTIQSVKVTFSTKDNGVLKYSNTSISSNTNCNINAQTASFTVGSTSGSKGKVLVKAIEVVYQKN